MPTRSIYRYRSSLVSIPMYIVVSRHFKVNNTNNNSIIVYLGNTVHGLQMLVYLPI